MVTVGSLLVAAVLELALRLTPQFDPYGWLIWGRQTIHLALDPAGAPSWKPLPWLLSTPLTLAGTAAPTLWLVVGCAGGVAALGLAFRIAHRIGGVLAGVVAVAGLVLCRDWVPLMVTGAIEPVTVALALAATERHLAGRYRSAAVLLMLVTLARPECALLLALYGLWLWFGRPSRALLVPRGRKSHTHSAGEQPPTTNLDARLLLAVGAAMIAALWILPPLISLGHGFSASDPVFQSGVASHNPLTVAYRGATIVIWPVAVLAGLALVLSRSVPAARNPTLTLAVGALAWVAATALMALVGFPGIRRFMLPAAAALCVLGGVGISLLWIRVTALPGRRRLLATALTVLLATAAGGWYGRFRVNDAVSSVRAEQARSKLVRSLHRVIVASGGARYLKACGSPSAKFGLQSTIAWDLGLPVGVVGFRPAHDIARRRHVVLFIRGRAGHLNDNGQLLGRAGPWRVFSVGGRCPARGAPA